MTSKVLVFRIKLRKKERKRRENEIEFYALINSTSETRRLVISSLSSLTEIIRPFYLQSINQANLGYNF